MPFHDFQGIQRHLDALGMFHMDLGLDRMRRALAALDLERPPFVVAQVLGTNGKGSTAAFLAELCAAHGCRAGLYTSPHFVSPQERIRVNGRPLAGEVWPDLANSVMAAASGDSLTYFEFLTLLALLAFREARVDVTIMEAGLGGRSDATTAVTADLLCYTPIAMDHAAVLGPTLADIARDKAAAIRGRAPVCMAPQFPAAREALVAAARMQGAVLVPAAPLPEEWLPRLGLAGEHQLRNAGLALAAWQRLAPLLGRRADDARAQALGLANAFLPGRLQFVPAAAGHPALLLDGAHNPHGMQALLRALFPPDRTPCRPLPVPRAIIFSCLADKDWHSSAAMLAHRFPHTPAFIPGLKNPRAADPHDAAAFWNARSPGTARALTGPHALEQALDAVAGACGADGGVTLMTGSLYLLAEFFALHPRLLEPPFSHSATENLP
ncbi:glutamate ligase domain-containing protein [uncultured Desulfovibrio sp.]|uniref:bifunctional folylpolyglutamate synthase/dihydrofolate synthase n=1 Tax=uncultured Desulfovibrio sp. TaxID=167968 RepID=UPI0028039FD2|nr:bifunctional folylpolyglutamate synthase/ dihydrofolate synthase [uncultured Desulfovibrio sp.]